MRRPDNSHVEVQTKKSRAVNWAEAEATAAAKEYVEPPPAHAYEQYRIGKTPVEFAGRVLEEEGRLTHRQAGGDRCDFVDGKYATPRMKLIEANKVLAREGLEQVGPGDCRV